MANFDAPCVRDDGHQAQKAVDGPGLLVDDRVKPRIGRVFQACEIVIECAALGKRAHEQIIPQLAVSGRTFQRLPQAIAMAGGVEFFQTNKASLQRAGIRQLGRLPVFKIRHIESPCLTAVCEIEYSPGAQQCARKAEWRLRWSRG